ncbi:splicing regulator ARVCF isoform X5 [Equus quagga]|nr:splicing regulator ARVCF isoform X5 [Equus quagga]XP_046496247.1 splicing regulator ARVCF isoform X5 [Equus quagga]
MPEAPEVLEETVTVEEDPGTPTSHVSIVTSEDGTTRRTETKVTKTVKTVTTRTVRQVPVGPDGLPLLDGGPLLGPFADGPLDRHFLLRGGGPAATLSRAYLSSGGTFSDSPEPREVPNYGSLSRGLGVRPPRGGPLGPGPGDGCFTLPGHRETFPVGPEPVLPAGRSQPERFQAEPYGLEDDTRSLAADDEGGADLQPDCGTTARRRPDCGRGLRTRAYEDGADDGGELMEERPLFPAATAPLAQPERGSLGSLDRAVRRSPSVDSARKEPRWRDPELPEVLAMLRHPVDPVKANAAAYLQHLCFENEGIKRRVRQLRGLPLLVALLDHPRAEVRRRACGALRNLSYGRDTDNKAAIRDCGGVPALVRLLRAARDNEVRELVTGTLWNLSSYEPLKMVIIDHGLQTLTHEVIVPHSGWEREPNEDSKPRDAEWTTVFKNTSGCLRNVSSDGAEARRRLRECEGLVDALLHALQSAVGRKDTDNKSVENCVCIMRNLSYHVHKEVPGAERYQEADPGPPGSAAGPQRRRRDDASCFGGKKAKGKKDGEMDRNFDTLDLPKRTEAAKGFELLYQPEVVRLYLSLLTESRNFNTLEAAAGALQNLSAGSWMWATYIRATVRKERGLPVLVELLQSETDKVVRAVAIALRNLSLDRRNKDLIGSYAMAELVRNVRSAQAQLRPGARLEEDTVVAVLNTIHEIVSDSLDNARSLLQAHGVPALVALGAASQSVREAKAASHVLQTLWSYKDLRGALQKEGWTKARFQSAAANAKGAKGTPSPGGFDDSTLPLGDKSLEGEKPGSRDVLPMEALGPEFSACPHPADGYSTVDRRERRARGSDPAGDSSEKEPLKGLAGLLFLGLITKEGNSGWPAQTLPGAGSRLVATGDKASGSRARANTLDTPACPPSLPCSEPLGWLALYRLRAVRETEGVGQREGQEVAAEGAWLGFGPVGLESVPPHGRGSQGAGCALGSQGHPASATLHSRPPGGVAWPGGWLSRTSGGHEMGGRLAAPCPPTRDAWTPVPGRPCRAAHRREPRVAPPGPAFRAVGAAVQCLLSVTEIRREPRK